MERSKTFTLKSTISKRQRTVFQAPDLSGMLQELSDVHCYWDHITLDPPKDKENVAIFADLRQVK